MPPSEKVRRAEFVSGRRDRRRVAVDLMLDASLGTNIFLSANDDFEGIY